MKNHKRLKKSLTNRFVGLMGIFVVILLLGITALEVYQHNSQAHFISKNSQLGEKHKAVENLERTFTTIFYDMRGYLAYDIVSMREDALQNKDETTKLIQLIMNTSNSNEDLLFLSEVTDFQRYYFEILIPEFLKRK